MFFNYQSLFIKNLKLNERKKSIALIMTIDGPDGASNSTERNTPEITEIIPTKVAIKAIFPGEVANLLEVAAGIINIAVIRSKPII